MTARASFEKPAFILKLDVTTFHTTRGHKLDKSCEDVLYIWIVVKLLKSLPD